MHVFYHHYYYYHSLHKIPPLFFIFIITCQEMSKKGIQNLKNFNWFLKNAILSNNEDFETKAEEMMPNFDPHVLIFNRVDNLLEQALRCNNVRATKFLLDHPLIIPDFIDYNSENTEFCEFIHEYKPKQQMQRKRGYDAFFLLMKDKRVNVNKQDEYGRTVLFNVVHKDLKPVFLNLIAFRGNDLDITLKGRTYFNDEYRTPLQVAEHLNYDVEMIHVLRGFEINKPRVIDYCRHKIGLDHELTAEFFAVIVLYSDDMLKLKSPQTNFLGIVEDICSDDAVKTRFIKIASKLPMELQMMLCNRVMNSNKTLVGVNHTENALRRIVKVFS